MFISSGVHTLKVFDLEKRIVSEVVMTECRESHDMEEKVDFPLGNPVPGISPETNFTSTWRIQVVKTDEASSKYSYLLQKI